MRPGRKTRNVFSGSSFDRYILCSFKPGRKLNVLRAAREEAPRLYPGDILEALLRVVPAQLRQGAHLLGEKGRAGDLRVRIRAHLVGEKGLGRVGLGTIRFGSGRGLGLGSGPGLRVRIRARVKG